jgi:cold shock CspA family protein
MIIDLQLDRHIRELQGKLAAPRRAKRKEKIVVGAYTGIVTAWLDDRKFGFVTITAGPVFEADGRDVFVGERGLAATGLTALKKGDRVRFDRLPSRKKGPGHFQAVNVTLDDVPAAKAA